MRAGYRWRAPCSTLRARSGKPKRLKRSLSSMRVYLLLVLLAPCALSFAQQQEIQRALVQRDQQSAEFAAQLRGSQERVQLERLHARQLSEALVPPGPEPALAAPLLSYQRSRMAEERELRFVPPIVRNQADGKLAAPLPLPGGPRAGVDPVAPDSVSR